MLLAFGLVLGATRASAAPAPGNFDDPDDVDIVLDIATVSHQTNADTVVLRDDTYDAFADKDVHATWAIDTDGRSGPEYLVAVGWDASTGAIVGEVDDAHGARRAPASVGRPTDHAVQVSFDRSAIGSPPAFTCLATTFVDTNGNGREDPGETDSAGPFAVGTLADRLAGADRIATAILAAQDARTGQQPDAAVLARADGYADALAGTPLAVAKHGPLLLTERERLNDSTGAELKSELAEGATVYLLGGEAALSSQVAADVQNLGYRVVRFAGADRFETALRVADEGLDNPSTLLLTTGIDFPDALSAGTAAAAKGGAVLLTAGSSMPSSVRAYLDAHAGATQYAIGGPAAAAAPDATPVVGDDRFATSRQAAEAFFSSPAAVGVASGRNFPDALSGGAHVGRAGGPLLLTEPSALPASIRSYLAVNKGTITNVTVYGGEAAVSEDTRRAIEAAVN